MNLVGETWALQMAQKAIDAGLQPEEKRLDRPINVKGVGTGQNSAVWELTIPIAVDGENGNANVATFTAPTVSGEGKDLPALLGLQSMSRNNGVLEMAEGREYLTYPGPGGYTINWSPGTKRYKLERAESGHLILPCDSFDKLERQVGGLPGKNMDFLASDAVSKVYAEACTQTEVRHESTNFGHRNKPTKKVRINTSTDTH